MSITKIIQNIERGSDSFEDLVHRVKNLLFKPSDAANSTAELRAFMALCKKQNLSSLTDEQLNAIAQCAHIFVFCVLRAGIEQHNDLLADSATQKNVKQHYHYILENMDASRPNNTSEYRLFHAHIKYAIHGIQAAIDFQHAYKLMSLLAIIEQEKDTESVNALSTLLAYQQNTLC